MTARRLYVRKSAADSFGSSVSGWLVEETVEGLVVAGGLASVNTGSVVVEAMLDIGVVRAIIGVAVSLKMFETLNLYSGLSAD